MISKRLQEISKMIDKNRVVFDVGSDHALLPCFLVEQGICEKVYAGDIALGPLEHAKSTIEKYSLEGKVIPVFSDGLKLARNDVDVVVISGMGYYTIEHILNEADVSRYQYFVVQSNTDVDMLRKYLSNHNYTIEDEKVVHDDFYYQIIKFSADYHEQYTEIEIKYGPILLKNKDEEFINFLNYTKGKLVEINKKANKQEYQDKISEINNILK